MKTKTRIRIIQILCVISLLITTFSIRSTYAKYYEKMNTSYSTSIKKWFIQLNGKDIFEEELSNIMEPTFIDDANINDGFLVPGRVAYFELDIDYTYVDVSFTINCEIIQQNATKLTDLQMYAYSIIEDGTETMYNSTDFSYSINIEEEGSKQKQMRIYFKWNDDENNLMNDLADTQFRGETQAGSDNTVLRYLVNITFTQT